MWGWQESQTEAGQCHKPSSFPAGCQGKGMPNSSPLLHWLHQGPQKPPRGDADCLIQGHPSLNPVAGDGIGEGAGRGLQGSEQELVREHRDSGLGVCRQGQLWMGTEAEQAGKGQQEWWQQGEGQPPSSPVS